MSALAQTELQSRLHGRKLAAFLLVCAAGVALNLFMAVENGAAWIVQGLARPDPTEIVERRVIARQQQMIAVVDGDAKRRVEIGSATSAGERRSLMHDDLAPRFDKAHRGAQARDSGADDMDGASAHRIPYRRSAPMRRSRLALARRRGGAKPSFTIRSRIEP